MYLSPKKIEELKNKVAQQFSPLAMEQGKKQGIEETKQAVEVLQTAKAQAVTEQNQKNKNVVLYVVGGLLVLVIGFFIYKKYR